MDTQIQAPLKTQKDQTFEKDGGENGQSMMPPAFAIEASPVQAQKVGNPAQMQSSGAVMQMKMSFKDAKTKITAAEGFWGTDEAAVYDAIRQVSAGDRKLLKADPAVQTFIKKYMSGHDLWKAQLLLEFGSEKAWPKPIKEIWASTDYIWGTDEERINHCLEKLTKAELTKLKSIPGLNKMLKSELSGHELKTVNQLLGGDYADAIKKHKDGFKKIQGVLTAMSTSSKLLEKNTAELIVPNKSKIEVVLLSTTHDAKERAKHHGKKKKVPWFGKDQKYPEKPGNYDSEITSTRNIKWGDSNSGGSLGNGTNVISLYNTDKHSTSWLKGLLIHECQHYLDHHEDEPGWAKNYKSPEESWVRYKTEFRSYWIDGDYDSKSKVSGSATAPWDNKKQKAIFDYMYNSSTYGEFLKPNYDNNTDVNGKKFKDLIHGYAQAEGVNLINSLRIDNFYDELKKCKRSDTDLTKSPLKELEVAAKALEPNDRKHINSKAGVSLQKMIKSNLEVKNICPHFAKLVNGGSKPGWAP